MSTPRQKYKIYMHLPSIANKKMKWQQLTRIKTEHHKHVQNELFGRSKPPLPVHVVLNRVGNNKRPMDDDNLRSAFKYVRDAVALWLGVDDGDTDNVTWGYGQEICKDGMEYITITFEVA